jgi:putative transposase
MENTMTNPNSALLELADKGADVDMLRQMVQFMAQRLMDMDVEGRCSALVSAMDAVLSGI